MGTPLVGPTTYTVHCTGLKSPMIFDILNFYVVTPLGQLP